MMRKMIRDGKSGRFLAAYPELKLSRCFFCGASATLEYSMPHQESGTCEGLYPRSYWVQCSECGARGPELDQEHAITEWEAVANWQGFPTKRVAGEAVCSAKYHAVIADFGPVNCGVCGTPLHR